MGGNFTRTATVRNEPRAADSRQTAGRIVTIRLALSDLRASSAPAHSADPSAQTVSSVFHFTAATFVQPGGTR